MNKSNFLRIGFIWLTLSGYNSSFREGKAGTETETLEDHYIVVSSLHYYCFAFLYSLTHIAYGEYQQGEQGSSASIIHCITDHRAV